MKDIKILEFFEVLDNQDSNAILIKKKNSSENSGAILR